MASLSAPVCVGLDPVLSRLPDGVRLGASSEAHAIETFSMGVIEAAQGVAPIVKFQSACFERYGGAGVSAMQRAMHAAREAGLLVILDAKRGDIGVSAEHYAVFAFEAMGADALTVSPYLGPETMRPYLTLADALLDRDGRGRGIFALVRTSNPDSDAIQSQQLKDGRTVSGIVASHVRALGADRIGAHAYSDVGAVVAATKPEDAGAMRSAMPEQVFLVPGYGAQGGDAASVRALFDSAGRGAIVTASRSVIYAFDAGEADWIGAIRTAAAALAGEVAGVAGAWTGG